MKVKRPAGIRVRYTTEKGITDTIKFDGLSARIFQHEYDHLHGIQYMNRVSKLTYDIAVRKRKKLRRQAVG